MVFKDIMVPFKSYNKLRNPWSQTVATCVASPAVLFKTRLLDDPHISTGSILHATASYLLEQSGNESSI